MFHITIEDNGFNLAQSIGKPFGKYLYPCHFFFHFFPGDPVGFTHTDNLVCGKRARSHASFMSASVHLGFQTYTWTTAYEQCSNPFGTAYFVCGQGHQIHFCLLQVNFHLAGGLRGIAMENHAFASAEFGDFIHRLDNADFIVDHHDGHQNGIRTNSLFQLFQGDQTIFPGIQISRLESFTFQFPECVQNRFVFGLDCDDVSAFCLVKLCGAFDGQVVCFRCA